MKTTRTPWMRTLGGVLGAAAMLGAVSGCQMMGMPQHGDSGKPPALPGAAIRALVFGAEGDVFVVDGEGRNVQGCVMPGTMDKSAQACGALTGTTVMSLKSVGFIRHTGSTCTTVGPIVHAGRVYYYQLPPGCTR